MDNYYLPLYLIYIILGVKLALEVGDSCSSPTVALQQALAMAWAAINSTTGSTMDNICTHDDFLYSNTNNFTKVRLVKNYIKK